MKEAEENTINVWGYWVFLMLFTWYLTFTYNSISPFLAARRTVAGVRAEL